MPNERSNPEIYVPSSDEQPETPPWHGSSLPFFVVMRDQSTYTLSPSYTKSLSTGPLRGQNGLPSANDNASSKDTFEPVRRGSSSYASGSMTQRGSVSRNTIHIYPEIHYIFSDDDEATISNNPNSNMGEATNNNNSSDNEIITIVDFDQSGQSVKNVNSISSNWQVTDISLSAGTDKHWLDSTTDGDIGSPTLFITGIKSSPYLRKLAKGLDNETGHTSRNEIVTDRFDPLSSSDMKSPEYTDHLIQMFKDRNDQLRKTLLDYTLE
ncbi:hypothetical protein NADFUDRAFT_83000 [Nadsonia fulvescens var. elongata DSM 6958]|uniref:Uncharacterized protein n=1 Tax=Nadsonia fulvescens var. elongata DSM 6958 TaxID=857566 RepID=A0A1E3PL36_9ASCO|nr:hypothetical protein NADFUDRAFT_83000 [Nadsonia fulvescens var. elongata DSM 6958]